MTPEAVKLNEKIKVGMFLSILSILILMLSSYLVYFYNTEPQRVLREDSVSFTYIAIALIVSVTAAAVGFKSIMNTYRCIMTLSN